MANRQSRAEFLSNNPHAKGWASLHDATLLQKGPLSLRPGCFQGKSAIILGSGIGGLTTAYELLEKKTGMQVTVLEAQNRTGGRCLSLRTGDTLVLDTDRELSGNSKTTSQVVRFERPPGDNEPYLNAGPGRIPSGHKRLLQYLKNFGVDVEVYVMDSSSNLVQTSKGYNGEAVVSRRLDHNTRGWVAQMVYQNAGSLIRELDPDISDEDELTASAKLQDLMVSFGDLNPEGKYHVGVPEVGRDADVDTTDRAGFTILPGVGSGVAAAPLSLDGLLESEFWKTNFYQAQNFLWQPTLFQPVGGMDRVQHAFAQQVAALGGTIHLNSPVKAISWNETSRKFEAQVATMGSSELTTYTADYCFSNMAMPFLEGILSPELLSTAADQGLDPSFKDGLAAVFKAQSEPNTEEGFPNRFLACTTKIGWQADRSLWQGSPIRSYEDRLGNEDEGDVEPSEIGVVPIFGGISRTDDEIVQIWYPSNDYHDTKGVLTGCYNYSLNAYTMGKMPIDKRLDRAREGASVFGTKFSSGLANGVAIAWQHVPYIKGGWAQWHLVGDVIEESVRHFNELIQGSGVNGSAPNFFVVGDQLSSIPGWQEGAIASALNALSRAADPGMEIPRLRSLPDTRIMVEGV